MDKPLSKQKLMDFIETQRIIINQQKYIDVHELLEWINDGDLDYDEFNLKEFGGRLKSLRKSYKSKTLMTQEKVAKKAGVSFDVYRRYEQGVRKPKKENLEKIAGFFDVTVNYLLGTEE